MNDTSIFTTAVNNDPTVNHAANEYLIEPEIFADTFPVEWDNLGYCWVIDTFSQGITRSHLASHEVVARTITRIHQHLAAELDVLIRWPGGERLFPYLDIKAAYVADAQGRYVSAGT